MRELGERAVVVLGNHDLHLVTQHEGFERKRKDDTFTDVLGAPDAKELVDWLRTRPMMHVEGNWAMVHAGLLPQWSDREGACRWRAKSKRRCARPTTAISSPTCTAASRSAGTTRSRAGTGCA